MYVLAILYIVLQTIKSYCTFSMYIVLFVHSQYTMYIAVNYTQIYSNVSRVNLCL